MTDRTAPFSNHVLTWCINGLLTNDLLSEKKNMAIGDFLRNKAVLTEIADVLNMRFANLQGWSWEAEDGRPVEPRRQLNGKHRIMMDEDILQAILLHYVGVSWSIQFKSEFKYLMKLNGVGESRSHVSR